jgi:PAS domain S-box-containing protein
LKLRTLPLGARLLIAGTLVAGAAAVAQRVPEATTWTRTDVLTLAGLVLAILVTEQFSVPLRLRTETLNFTLTDAAFTAGLILARPSVVTLAVLWGVVAGQLMKRWDPLKVAFNVGTYLVGITAAEVVYHAFGPTGARDPEAWGAAAAAMAVFAVANILLVSSILSLVERKPPSRLIESTLALDLAHRAGNTTIGVAFAVVRTVNPVIAPPVLVFLALAYLAYEAWVETLRERDEIRTLYEVERHLLAPIETTADLQPVLEVARRMLRASRVELSLLESEAGSQTGLGGPASVVASVNGHAGGSAGSNGERERLSHSAQVAMVGGPEGLSGMVIVHRERPLDDAERSVLEAVASKISVMLHNNRLFRETLEQAELADVVSHTWDGIFVIAPTGNVLSWNPSMERITGLGRGEVLGRDCKELLGIDAPAILGTEDGPGDEASRDLVLTKADGGKRWLNYRLHPLGGRAGQRNFVVVVRDVTAELETEQLKADFVATVSHELRTPLTPLKGFLITLLHGVGDGTREERQSYYRIMLNQANRLERLITDLLEASRIESGEPVVDLKPVDLKAEVASIVDAFVEQYPDRTFRLDLAEESVSVHGDPLRIDQIVTNLVSNAVKYSPRAEPIDVKVRGNGRDATVEVRDRGQGIAPQDQDRIFERFFRVDNALTRQAGGTGLGLYLSKKLADAMRGRLSVESTPGRGAAFVLALPRYDRAMVGAAPGSDRR